MISLDARLIRGSQRALKLLTQCINTVWWVSRKELGHLLIQPSNILFTIPGASCPVCKFGLALIFQYKWSALKMHSRPQIDGKMPSVPTPGFIQATSYSESSGLCRKYISFCLGRSRIAKYSLREVKISLGWQNQCLRLNRGHRLLEVTVVRFLLGDVSILPGLHHHQQVLGV